MNNLKYATFALLAAAALGACSKNKDVTNYPTVPAGSSLQASSPVTIGLETDYTAALDSPLYLQTAAANASQTTFGDVLKNATIMQSDGSLSFTKPDAQMQAVNQAGIKKVWGNTLCYYQENNTTFLSTLAGYPAMPNLLPNPDFEDWSGSTCTGWTYANGNGSYGNFTQGTGGANVQSGSSSMAVAILDEASTITSCQSGWHLQLVSASFPTIVGHTYKVTYYAKGSTAGCYMQVEWDHAGSVKYGGTIGANGTGTGAQYALSTAWTQYNMSTGTGATGEVLTASATTTSIAFDLAYNPPGATVYLDNIQIIDYTEQQAGAFVDTAEVQSTLQSYVTGVVSHYKGQVTGWDVINELFADDGSIRNNTNTNTSGQPSWFVWSDYLGKSVGVTAFNAAHAADPSAMLFINDYGLEGGVMNTATSTSYGTRKLDSLIAYVGWLQQQGVHIDGIGTEMHININTAQQGIDYMFQRLAATGLKVRISELDVSLDNIPSNSGTTGFVLTPQVLAYQATMYHNVVASYLKNVPAAQRQDITVWGVNDCNSWHYGNGTDFPLLFDNSYAPKPAYSGFLQALKGQ